MEGIPGVLVIPLQPTPASRSHLGTFDQPASEGPKWPAV